MKVTWDRKALKDYQHFEQHAPKLAQRVRDLITDIKRSPHSGIGKPEPLRFDYAGFWSRRIDREHRLIYKVEDETLFIAACRWHYGQ